MERPDIIIISARRSYADLIIKPFMDKDTKGGYYLYDINTKLNHRFSDRDRLFSPFIMAKIMPALQILLLITLKKKRRQTQERDESWLGEVH